MSRPGPTTSIPSSTNLNFGLGIDFQNEGDGLSALAYDRGEILYHEMAVACTCESTASGDPIYGAILNCLRCEDMRYVYRNQRKITGVVLNISSQRRYTEIAEITPGDCILSVPGDLQPGIGDFDKITFTWPQPVNEGEVKVRGRWHELAPSQATEDEDRLVYQGAFALRCEDENDVVYYEGADFVLDARLVRWVGARPKKNVRYTIKYEGFLEWICWASPFERRDAGRDLGQRVLLRKRHVALVQEDPSSSPRKRLGFGVRRTV